MADLGFPEEPLEPAAVEAVAVEDVCKAVSRVHARVVCKLCALNQDWGSPRVSVDVRERRARR